MENTKKIINKYKCTWLDLLLKEALQNRDLKTYNRIKCVVYYYPEILRCDMHDFKAAFKYANETYICLHNDDKRYLFFDKIYSMLHNGADFEEDSYGEKRYLTIEQICKYFKI